MKGVFKMSTSRSRTLAFIASAAMAVMPFVGLYIAASAEYDAGNNVTVSVPAVAKKGAVFDRDGELLAYDEERLSVCLLPSLFYSDEAVNSALVRLITADKKIAEGFSLPVDKKGEAAGDKEALARLASAVGLEKAQPEELLKRLYEVFGISKKSEYAYETACLRYNALMSADELFLLSSSPSQELKEQAEILAQSEPFVRVEKSFERIYSTSEKQPIAPHTLQACESAFEKELSGISGVDKRVFRLYQGGYSLKENSPLDPTDGQDITLTIDKTLQLKAQSLLLGAIKGGKCTAGSLCVVSCKTGEILALASAPDFDLNTLRESYEKLSSDSAAPLFDRSLWGLYRPGSAMKTITALAALDTGAIDKDTFLWCGRWYPLGNTTFSCLYYHGYESVQTALRDSCNVFFYKCSQLIGIDTLAKYQQDMGLGKSVDIVLPNASGRVVTPESVSQLGIAWSEGLLLQSAIGQSETAVTPLQMAQWAQIIANKGSLNPLTISLDKKPKAQRIIKNDFAFEQIRQGMIMAADNIWGEDSLYSLPEKTAIKTGTPETGSGYNSTVIGFYPADKPEIAFSIVLENSENSKSLIRPLLEEWVSISKG